MIDEHKEEIAALYALGVLEPGEARAFEQEMHADAELQSFVDDMLRHSTALAHAVPAKPAPPHLREKVLQSIRTGTGYENVVPYRRPFAWLPWAMAAGFAVACGLLFNDRARLKNEIVDLQSKNDVCQMQVAMLDSMSGKPQQGIAVVIWDPSTQTGVLKGEDMPRPAANQDYQLWAVDSRHPQPVNAGVFNVDDKGVAKAMFKPAQPVNGQCKFAVSIERKGGVPQHEGPIVMGSK